jgi:diguanylate cyclase (GGDEF)-like protein
LSAVPASPLDGPLVQGIRRHLEGLKGSPDGAALYMMIERGLRRYGGAGQMEDAFIDFLHGMLARYAKDPNTDPATRVKARLIQQRLALALPQAQRPAAEPTKIEQGHAAPSPNGLEQWPQASDSQPEVLPTAPILAVGTASLSADPPLDRSTPLPERRPRAPTSEGTTGRAKARSMAALPATKERPQEHVNAPMSETERPTTSQFEEVIVRPASAPAPENAPADQSPGNLSVLAETLAEKVTESITSNKDFDEIVKTEQSALERADKAIGDFNDLKQLLVRGLDDLVRERDDLKERLSTAAEFLKAVESDRRKLKGELGRLRKQALADELTGLPKREVFVKSLEAEISRVRRYGFALALAVLDVDGLERINMQYGREAGDAVLRSYANEILANFRTYDLVARYGEDEFAVLFPNTQKEGALRALEKAQKRASETYLSHDGRSFPVPTFSSVLTLYTPGEKPEQLLRRAEGALDHAKLKGHARMVVALPGA